jgi:hypothetical protein
MDKEYDYETVDCPCAFRDNFTGGGVRIFGLG